MNIDANIHRTMQRIIHIFSRSLSTVVRKRPQVKTDFIITRGARVDGSERDPWFAVAEQVTLGLYDTESHRLLVKELDRRLRALDNGSQIGHNGAGTRCFVGAKGIGKSTIMENFTRATPKLASVNTTCCYISFNNIVSSSRFESRTVMDVLNEEIRKVLGQKHEKYVDSQSFAQYLYDNNHQVLLLVDELDQLYRQGNSQHVALYRKNLSELAYIGDDTSGVMACVVCGSSAVLPQLITSTVPVGLENEFTLKDLPNLNGTKYRSTRIPSILPTNLKDATYMMSHRATKDKNTSISSEMVKLFVFFYGANPRNMGLAQVHLQTDKKFPSPLEISDPSGSQQAASTMTNPIFREVYITVMRKLADVNKDIVLNARNACTGTFHLEYIMNGEWASIFKPAHVSDLDCFIQNGVDKIKIDKKQVQNALIHLHDHGYITIEIIENGEWANAYPMSIAQVAMVAMENQFSFNDNIQKYVPQMLTIFKDALEISSTISKFIS